MKTTPKMQIGYPEPGDHTRTWEYWQGQAERVDQVVAPAALRATTTTGFRVTGKTAVDWSNKSVEYPSGAWIWNAADKSWTVPYEGLYACTLTAQWNTGDRGKAPRIAQVMVGSEIILYTDPNTQMIDLVEQTMLVKLAAGAKLTAQCDSQGTWCEAVGLVIHRVSTSS